MNSKYFILMFLLTIVLQTTYGQQRQYLSSDLQLYDLYGPVASVQLSEYNTIHFDRQGRLMKKDPEEEIVRDKFGRIIVDDYLWGIGVDSQYLSEYEYNNDGTIATISTDAWEYYQKEYFFYDPLDKLYMTVVEWSDLLISGVDVIEYTILETDRHGNWTKRIVDKKSIVTDFEESGHENGVREKHTTSEIETRRITYYSE